MRRPLVKIQRSVEAILMKVVWEDLRALSGQIYVSLIYQIRVVIDNLQRTTLLKISHGLVMLPAKLRPFRKVVLSRHRAQFTFDAHHISLETDLLSRSFGRGSREFTVKNP